jgi:hypothetical protein
MRITGDSAKSHYRKLKLDFCGGYDIPEVNAGHSCRTIPRNHALPYVCIVFSPNTGADSIRYLTEIMDDFPEPYPQFRETIAVSREEGTCFEKSLSLSLCYSAL